LVQPVGEMYHMADFRTNKNQKINLSALMADTDSDTVKTSLPHFLDTQK
jgi:hypothetical protein